MDFLNVIDQAVRQIKREVNLKVFKVPEIKQQVIDATNDEPWGPHGSDLFEIANATQNHKECQMVMEVIWVRLSDDISTNWRNIYKALTVIEYLISNGSDRAVDEIIDHGFRIFSIPGSCCDEPNGKDVRMNIRKKAKTIFDLLNDGEKIKELRDKAFANRDKYAGASSPVIRYKLGTDSNISRCAYQNSYDTREDQLFKYSYSNCDEIYTGDTENNYTHKMTTHKPRRSHTHYIVGNNSKIEAKHINRNKPNCCSITIKLSSMQHSNPSTKISSSTISSDDDFDPRGYSTIDNVHLQEPSITDYFNPRGSNTAGDLKSQVLSLAGLPSTNTNQVDLFAKKFISQSFKSGSATEPEVDLFDAAPYVSYPPQEPVKTVFQTWDTVNLFGNQPEVTSFPVKEGLYDQQFDAKSLKPEATDTSTEPDLFDSLESLGSQLEAEPAVQTSTNTVSSNKKEFFRVKSKIWADELSRGLINLNITTSDQPAKPCMAKSMGVRSKPTIDSSTISSMGTGRGGNFP